MFELKDARKKYPHKLRDLLDQLSVKPMFPIILVVVWVSHG
ncbi:MAG: hypothetical protein ACJAUP_001847 [Cellvibrionaceae bacterium]|jgi:hypothetical protein